MKKLAIATCAVVSLGLTGCTHDPQERGALRGGGLGLAAGALASLVIPGIGLWGGAVLGMIGGAGIGAATSKGKNYHHSESERRPVDANSPVDPAPTPAPAEAAPEAPSGG